MIKSFPASFVVVAISFNFFFAFFQEDEKQPRGRSRRPKRPKGPSASKILVIGADLKHVLRTVAGSVDFKGSFQFVLTDSNPQIQARNLVLLGLLLRPEEAAEAGNNSSY